jgi:biopolymer transport protein ExbD
MPLKTSQGEAPAVNLTPMIDIVFLLIIFFMVGTKFTEAEKSFSLQLPSSGQPAAMVAPPVSKTVWLLPDGQLRLDQQPTRLEELPDLLRRARQQYPELSVVVRSDAQQSVQQLVAVLDATQSAGVASVSLASQLNR